MSGWRRTVTTRRRKNHFGGDWSVGYIRCAKADEALPAPEDEEE